MGRAENPLWFFFAPFAVMGFACLSGIAMHNAAAQQYPTKPIRVIALSSPASGPDIVGRPLGQKFTEAWGQQVIVDTRPGASGIIGAEIARVLKTPEFRERLAALGAEPISSTPQELAEYMRVQTGKMRKAVKDSGARPD